MAAVALVSVAAVTVVIVRRDPELTLAGRSNAALAAELATAVLLAVAALATWRASGVFAGGSGLHRIDWSVPRFEIGYWVRARFLGRGYATEAVRAIAERVFGDLGARRVEIRMHAANERSVRVAERAGFALEAVLRNEQRHLDGTLRDTRVYALVR